MSNETRRKLLKSGAVSGVVVAGSVWVKPVIETVTLPAHAATSEVEMDAPTPDSFAGAASSLGAVDPEGNPLIDALIKRAHAGLDDSSSDGLTIFNVGDICIKSNGDGTVKVDAVAFTRGSLLVSASSASLGSAADMDTEFCGELLGSSTGSPYDSGKTSESPTLLEALGVITEAQAGVLQIPVDLTVTVEEVGERAKGFFESGNLIFPFDIPAAPCEAPSCPPPGP